MMTIFTTLSKTLHKVAEVLIISPTENLAQQFIAPVASDLVQADQRVVFGRIKINEDLTLLLYGLESEGRSNQLVMELLGRRLLGCIVLFDWYSDASFESCKKLVDSITFKMSLPLMIAANVQDKGFPFSSELFEPYLSLSQTSRFTYYSSQQKSSIQNVLSTLVDIVIEHPA